MAELLAALGAISAVGTIVSEGTKLSREIHDYIRRVQSAEKDIKLIAHDVESTAMLLQQFEKNLKMEQETRVCSAEFYSMTDQSVYECRVVFKDIRAALPPMVFLESEYKDDAFKMKGREKIRWPFRNDKIAPLRANIDRLKVHLNSMLLVMRHARDIHERQLADEEKSFEIELELKTLELKKQDIERKFRALRGDAVETHTSAQWPRELMWNPKKRGKSYTNTLSEHDLSRTRNYASANSQPSKLPFFSEPNNDNKINSEDTVDSSDEPEWTAKQQLGLGSSIRRKESPPAEASLEKDDDQIKQTGSPKAELDQEIPTPMLQKLEAYLDRIAMAQENLNFAIMDTSRSRAAAPPSDKWSSGRFGKRTTPFEGEPKSIDARPSRATNAQAIDTHSDSGISWAEGDDLQATSLMSNKFRTPINAIRKPKPSGIGFTPDSGIPSMRSTAMVQETSIPRMGRPSVPLSISFSRSLSFLPLHNQHVTTMSEPSPKLNESIHDRKLESVALKRLLLDPPSNAPDRLADVRISTTNHDVMQNMDQAPQIDKLKRPIDPPSTSNVVEPDPKQVAKTDDTNGKAMFETSKCRMPFHANQNEISKGYNAPRRLEISETPDLERRSSLKGESLISNFANSGEKTPSSIKVEANSVSRRADLEDELQRPESGRSGSETEELRRSAGRHAEIEDPHTPSVNSDKSAESNNIASWLKRIPGSKKMAKLVNRDQRSDVEDKSRPKRDLKARVESVSDESLVPVKNVTETLLEPVKRVMPIQQTSTPNSITAGAFAAPRPTEQTPVPKPIPAKANAVPPLSKTNGTGPVHIPPPLKPKVAGSSQMPPPPKSALKSFPFPSFTPVHVPDHNLGVINLDDNYQPNLYTTPSWSNSTIQPILELWTFRRAPPRDNVPHRTWKRATRVIVPLRMEEIEKLINQKAKRKPLWEKYESLSFFQQHQIDRLVREKRTYDPDPSSEYSLAALETWPKKAKNVDITSMQVVLHRYHRSGGPAIPHKAFPNTNQAFPNTNPAFQNTSPVPSQRFGESTLPSQNKPPYPPPPLQSQQQSRYNSHFIPPRSFDDPGGRRPHVSFPGPAPRQNPSSSNVPVPPPPSAPSFAPKNPISIPKKAEHRGHKRRPARDDSHSKSSSRRWSGDGSSTFSSDGSSCSTFDDGSYSDEGSWQPTRRKDSRKSEPRSMPSSVTIDLPRRSFSRRVQTVSDWDLEEDRLEMETRLDRLNHEVARRSGGKARPTHRGSNLGIGSELQSGGPRTFGQSKGIDESSMRDGKSGPLNISEMSGPYYSRYGGPLRQSQVPPYAYGKPGQGSLIDEYLAKWTIVNKDPPHDQDGPAEQVKALSRRNPYMSGALH